MNNSSSSGSDDCSFKFGLTDQTSKVATTQSLSVTSNKNQDKSALYNPPQVSYVKPSTEIADKTQSTGERSPLSKYDTYNLFSGEKFDYGLFSSKQHSNNQTGGFKFGSTDQISDSVKPSTELANKTQSTGERSPLSKYDTYNLFSGEKYDGGFKFGTPKSSTQQQPKVRTSSSESGSFGVSSTLFTIPSNSISYCLNDFHDLNVEIHDENGLFTTVKTHRIIVGVNNGRFAELVKHATKKNDMYFVELSTSDIPESILGKTKAIAFQHAITSYFQQSTAQIEDVFQILIVMDYLGIQTIS